mmetsp:Transcript_85928/g.192139  ORF Transcript_85928/g.192139 Transcript_85928/m.192139 type:complete len:131 (-) Transcript_85928:151-543(-)
MSCFVGNLGNHLTFVEDKRDADLWSQQCMNWSFDCTSLALLFTMVTYAYLVFLIKQEDESSSSKDVSLFWIHGGQFVIAGIAPSGSCSTIGELFWQSVADGSLETRAFAIIPPLTIGPPKRQSLLRRRQL